MHYRDIDSRHVDAWGDGDWCVTFITDAHLPWALRERLEHELTVDYDLTVTPLNDGGQEIVLWHRGTIAEAMTFGIEVMDDAILDYCLHSPKTDLGFHVVDVQVMSLEAWRVYPGRPNVLQGTIYDASLGETPDAGAEHLTTVSGP